MKVKFNEISGIMDFINKGRTLYSDITVHSDHRYVVDGKSLMGLLSLDLAKPLRIEFIEKKDGEESDFTIFCKKLGILLD